MPHEKIFLRKWLAILLRQGVVVNIACPRFRKRNFVALRVKKSRRDLYFLQCCNMSVLVCHWLQLAIKLSYATKFPHVDALKLVHFIAHTHWLIQLTTNQCGQDIQDINMTHICQVSNIFRFVFIYNHPKLMDIQLQSFNFITLQTLRWKVSDQFSFPWTVLK